MLNICYAWLSPNMTFHSLFPANHFTTCSVLNWSVKRHHTPVNIIGLLRKLNFVYNFLSSIKQQSISDFIHLPEKYLICLFWYRFNLQKYIWYLSNIKQ